jgi:hypothetical protein
MKPPKLIHIRNGKRNFIRFSGKPRMIIEVLQFDSATELDHALSNISSDIKDLEMIAFNASKVFQDKHYLFYVTQYTDGYQPDDENKILRNLNYAVDWYIHQCIKLDL